MRPNLLYVCCNIGGATAGFQRAGFRVTGVDIVEQPDYCGDDLIVADGLDFLGEHGHKFDAIATSWPCQASSAPTKGTNAARNAAGGRGHVDLNPAGRELLDATGRPYVMENVEGSDLRRDLTLCGLMFGLRVFRHRKFELGRWTMPPRHCRKGVDHRGHRVRGWRHGEYHDGDMLAVYGDGGGKATTAECREALGIDWSWDRARLVEAIPPAYTEYVGAGLMAHLVGLAVAA